MIENGKDPSLTVAEAAHHLGVTRKVVYDEIRSGALPAYRPGRHYRILLSALKAYRQRVEVRPDLK